MMKNRLIYLIKRGCIEKNLQVAYKAGKDVFGLGRLNFTDRRAKK